MPAVRLPHASNPFFEASGPTGALHQGFAWEEHPLGPPERWHDALKTQVRSMLKCAAPMFVCWGPEARLIYNEAYAQVLRDKHPLAIGRPFRQVWAEVDGSLDTMLQQVMAGEGLHGENSPFLVRREGRDETAWFSFVWNPMMEVGDSVQGFYCIAFETTAAVQAEQARTAQMERLVRMFEQAPGFIAVLSGPQHVFVQANPAYLEFVGRQDIIGQRVQDAIPETLEEGWIGVLDKVYTNGAPFVGQAARVRLIREGRSTLDDLIVNFVFQPIRDDGGVVTGILIQGHDITEHQQTLAQLRQSEQASRDSARKLTLQQKQLEALLEATPVGISLSDAGGRLLLASAENQRLWGWHPMPTSIDDYAGWKAWWADGSTRDGQRLAPHEWAVARALRGEEVLGDIIESQSFDEPPVRRTLLLRAKPILDDEGRVVNAVMAAVDIGAQVRIEKALRESEAKFRTIADAMPQMVWSTRIDGHHDYYNRQWYAFTGVPEGTTDGRGWNGMFHPDDQQRAWERWHRSLATGETYEIEYRLRHRSGEYRWVLGRALPVRDEQGQIIRWMGTCTDIHDQVKAQELLREGDSRKDEFLAMLAHELRNPLAPITSAAALLPRVADDARRVATLATLVGRQAAHMRGLIDDLLDVSRVTRGLVTLILERVDLRDVLSEALEQTRPLVESRNHRVEIRLGAQSLMVQGDRKRLVQIFSNVLTNAAKYTPEEGRVAIEARAQGERIFVLIRDNGQGMTPDMLERAFELFMQGERTPDRSQGGLGIGLALVRRMVDLHGGKVVARSEGPGHGSEFEIELPRAQPLAPAMTEGTPSPGPTRSSKARVLVVDDNQDGAEVLAMLLQQLGYDVHVEFTASKALETARLVRPQVCLLDIGLPDQDGRTLAGHLRALPGLQDAAIAVISGYGQPQDIAASHALGLAHFVKPVEPDEIADWLWKKTADAAAVNRSRASAEDLAAHRP